MGHMLDRVELLPSMPQIAEVCMQLSAACTLFVLQRLAVLSAPTRGLLLCLAQHSSECSDSCCKVAKGPIIPALLSACLVC